MTFRSFLIILSGAGLMACSSLYVTAVKSERLTVSGPKDPALDSLIQPYRDELGKAMSRKIGYSVQDLTVQRPNSLMGQYVTDLLVKFTRDSLLSSEQQQLQVTAFINTGGLRAAFSKGDVTVGDVYKLMPFDNQVVLLKLPVSVLPEMGEYIRSMKGEPISGLTYANGEVKIIDQTNDFFWVVTSDFLANGGDKMYFFGRAVERINTSILLRDVILFELSQHPQIEARELEERIRL